MKVSGFLTINFVIDIDENPTDMEERSNLAWDSVEKLVENIDYSLEYNGNGISIIDTEVIDNGVNRIISED